MGALRVLQAIGAMDLAGAETMIMNIYRNIDRDKVQFDFLVNADRKCAYDDEIEDMGGHIYRIPYYRIINFHSYRKACANVLGELSGTHPIIHGHIGAPAAIYLSEAKRKGYYTIAHSHAKHHPINPTEIAFRLSTYPTRFVADYFFACSHQAGIDRYGKRIVNSERFSIIPNGIDAASFSFDNKKRETVRTELGIGNEIVVGHVGRFEEVKNHAFLLETFASFHQMHQASKLVLVGSGPLMEQMKTRADKLGISDSTLFVGNRTDMPNVYASFDVFVFPSFTEGLSVALLEAQGSGLPCVVSEANSDEGIVSKTVHRLSLSEGAEAWAMQIAKSIENPCDRSMGFKDIQQHGFDINDSAIKLQQFYLEHASRG